VVAGIVSGLVRIVAVLVVAMSWATKVRRVHLRSVVQELVDAR